MKIMTFVSNTPTTVKIQVWTALITILMVRFMQLKSQWGWPLLNLMALLRMNLFTRRDLWAWFNNALGVPRDSGARSRPQWGFKLDSIRGDLNCSA